MAVQLYSDSSDEVTGSSLNGGETGGRTKVGELLGVTGGPKRRTGHVRHRDADRRPISGGSVNPNPTTPVSA